MFQRREANGRHASGGRSVEESGWKSKEDSSQTAPGSSDSSCERNVHKLSPKNSSSTAFDLPQWEHPGFQKSVDVKHSRPPVPPQQYRQESIPAASPGDGSNNPRDSRPGILEDMIVACNNSNSSFGEITLGEFSGSDADVPHRGAQQETSYRSSNNNNGLLGPPRGAGGDEDSITAEMAQEEEIFKLAIERSLQDSGSVCSSHHSFSRSSPQRTCSATMSRTQPAFRSTPRRTSSSNSRIQTDTNTGQQFIWKKAPNNRYIKVTINGLDDGSVYGGSAASNQTCNRSIAYSAEESLELMEQKMLEEALNRSLAEVSLEGASVASEASGLSSASSVSATRASSTTTSRSSNTKFIWKKGPNNRYIKCPIALDQVNEGEVYENRQASRRPRLEQVEEEMFREAMERSMRDL